MSIAKITLFGLYNYDNSLFDDMILPSHENLDRDTLIESIIVACGEFEPLYADFDLSKMSIKNWSQKWYHTIDKWCISLLKEYEPLENYNRVEHWEDEGSGNSEVNTDSETHIHHRTYDNNTLTETDKTATGSNATGETTTENIRDGYARGNIGVTTSQQMLQSELDLYKGFNLYDEIVNLFKTEIIIGVYE